MLIDPYTYRERLTMPKLIMNGANDRYWATDALNLYWDGLKGDKWVLYVPNAGHNLQQKLDGKMSSTRVNSTLSAFSKAQMKDLPLPKLSWKHDAHDGKLRLTVNSDVAPKAARLWGGPPPPSDIQRSMASGSWCASHGLPSAPWTPRMRFVPTIQMR